MPNTTTKRPPIGKAVLYYLRETNTGIVRFIGWSASQYKTYGAILSDKRTGSRSGIELKAWLAGNDVELVPIAFIPKEMGRSQHRLAVRAAQEAGWPLLNTEPHLTTPEQAKTNRRAWKQTPAGRASQKRVNKRREMRERGAYVEDVSKAELRNRFNGRCAYCQIDLPQDEGLWDMEHIIALVNGGEHSYSNCVPACRPCNNDKLDRCPIEYMASRGIQVFPL